jgi:Domain of unknown function (DUF4260)
MASGVDGGVKAGLRLEGLVLAAAALVLYGRSGAGWGQYFALWLIPDLSLAAYLVGPRAGALAYNALHSEVGPLLLGLAAVVGLLPGALPIALIWASHVGIDRGLGYGLKYGLGFGHTHLGAVGMVRRPAAKSA